MGALGGGGVGGSIGNEQISVIRGLIHWFRGAKDRFDTGSGFINNI